MMLLNALLPDSLVHITSKGIRFESTKSPGRNCLAGCLSIESLDGKLLKSPTAVSESLFFFLYFKIFISTVARITGYRYQ